MPSGSGRPAAASSRSTPGPAATSTPRWSPAACEQLDPPAGSFVMVENVGNLVCPALFDLGECAKVVIASVTEGEDKPLKYPHMFRASALLVLNKIDLLPYVSFDEARFIENARQVNPAITIVRVSATRGDGLEAWYTWLRDQKAVAV